jgi:hypothetical protein
MNEMKKQYCIFEGDKIIKMSESKKECIDYRLSFPMEIRKNMIIAERIVAGNKEFQKGFWDFNDRR